MQLPLEMTADLARYQRALMAAPLSPTTRSKYAARVRGYLHWLQTAYARGGEHDSGYDAEYHSRLDGDPLVDAAARDRAVRDWQIWAKTTARLRPTTINNTLAALDDFYTRRGLGPALARRESLHRGTPKALTHREVVRYLRAVEHTASPRDRLVALLPYYAGLRVGEAVRLDVDDVEPDGRKGQLRIRGKGPDGGTEREVPLTRPELRIALADWLDVRPAWSGADGRALLLNRRGGRLSDRSARTVITGLGEQVGLVDPAEGGFGPHVLRHTFATEMLRDGADHVLVADLLGHATLDSLRIYTTPTDTTEPQPATFSPPTTDRIGPAERAADPTDRAPLLRPW